MSERRPGMTQVSKHLIDRTRRFIQYHEWAPAQ